MSACGGAEKKPYSSLPPCVPARRAAWEKQPAKTAGKSGRQAGGEGPSVGPVGKSEDIGAERTAV